METKNLSALAQGAVLSGALSLCFKNPAIFQHFAAMRCVDGISYAISMAAKRVFPTFSSKWRAGATWATAVPVTYLIAEQIGYPLDKFFLIVVALNIYGRTLHTFINLDRHPCDDQPRLRGQVRYYH